MRSEERTTGAASPIEGEVIAHEDAGVRVRLEGGRIGLLPRSAGPNLAIGYRSRFRIDRQLEDGTVLLSIFVATAEPPRHTFDQEFDRLQDALANHGPHRLRERRTPADAVGQERIERWMTDVDEAIARLRKRRAKRVNSQT